MTLRKKRGNGASGTESPRINFRPLLFCALGLVFGIYLYGKARFSSLGCADFLFPVLFIAFALPPFTIKRTLAVLLCIGCSAGIGTLSLFLYSENFCNTFEAGEYRLAGTVVSVGDKSGYSILLLDDLTLGGEEAGGKCRLIISEKIPLGERILVTARVEPISPDFRDRYLVESFARDIRYSARAEEYESVGRTRNPFLRLNGALHTAIHKHMERDEADVIYALLTGSSSGMDGGLSGAVKRGGVAHIFAVSGLHIGILYGALSLVCKKMGKFRFLPPLLFAVCYTAMCNFTASSVRAVVMCGVLGISRASGRKYDFLESISFAALLLLLFSPGQWYGAGFRLSFGACLGLALFSGSLKRLFRRLRPAFLAEYLSACLSVQLFTFPILLDAFGFFSLWGFLLNFLILPLLAPFFLGTLLCAILALAIPPAASFFLLFPRGMADALLFLFSAMDFTFVLTGFALGAGAVLFLIACVGLCQRFRLSVRPRALTAAGFALLFAFVVTAENVVFGGVRITVFTREEGAAALIRTGKESVLLIDGELTLSDGEDFLARTYGGKLDLAVAVAENESAAANIAAFLGAEELRLCDRTETGLHMPVKYGRAFACGGLEFYFESRGKLVMRAEGVVVEFDFDGKESSGADLFIGRECGGLKYTLKDGIIGVR